MHAHTHTHKHKHTHTHTSENEYSSDMTNLGSKDGEKNQKQCQKRTLKTNIIKMCVKVKLVVSMNKYSNVY